MRIVVFGFLSLLLLCCSPAKREAGHTPPPDHPDKPATQTPPPLPVVQENLTMFGAVVTALTLSGEDDYVLQLELRTALPASHLPSLVEPGQNVIVRPLYVKDENGAVMKDNERNKRLHEVRTLAEGEPLIGRISLGQDGIWYLIDTGLQ